MQSLRNIKITTNRKAASALQRAVDALDREDYTDALFLLAESESLLLRDVDPPREILRELAPLRIELAALETDKEG